MEACKQEMKNSLGTSRLEMKSSMRTSRVEMNNTDTCRPRVESSIRNLIDPRFGVV